jgi:type II secretory pathway pseudopilin PulG
MRTVSYKKPFQASVLVVLIATIGIGLVAPLVSRRREGIANERIEMQSLLNALHYYQAEFDKYPSGSSSEILQALLGNNPKKRVLLETRSTNNAGQFVDPWGTPYEITFESTNHVMIRSAGKNRSFGDKDDVTAGTSRR